MYHHRSRTTSVDSMGSPTQPELHERSMSLGSIRPSLVWLFNHIRQEDSASLSKEDLRKFLGSQVDSVQLDQAFENLDVDGDGEISLEEFIAGFARFWKEAPHAKDNQFSLSPSHLLPVQKRVSEEQYEYGGEEYSKSTGPSEHFQKTLSALSSHNKNSMEHLWQSLKEANPELLTDFEDFVAEVASEVEGAQRALDNQRRANKREAIELDNEIESRLSAAQTTLHIQTSLVRQEEKTKLERRLIAKEAELFTVRNQLEELETEIVETHMNRSELEQQCQDLWKEKQELEERLEESERKLKEKEANSRLQAVQELKEQEQRQSSQESELQQHKKAYEEEIAKLKKQLEVYGKMGKLNEDEEVEVLMQRGVAHPDLLVTTHSYPTDKDSLMEEIAQKEGMASPLLRREHVLQPSPFLRSTRSGSFIRKKKKKPSNLKSNAVLSLSLPNLADVDELESPLPNTNRFSVIIPSSYDNDESASPAVEVRDEEGSRNGSEADSTRVSSSPSHSEEEKEDSEDSFLLSCKVSTFF